MNRHLTDFDPLQFHGVKIPDAYRMSIPRTDLSTAVPGIKKWQPYVNIVDDQGHTGTCEARSACCWVEIMARAYGDPMAFAPDLQLNAPAVHRLAWMMVNDRPATEYSDQDGLPLGASFQAMIELGILPADAQFADIPQDPVSMALALAKAPLQGGYIVHDGWGAKRIKENGEIPKPIGLPGFNGHAIVHTSCYAGKEGVPMFDIVNSWGSDWAWHGIGQMPWGGMSWTMLRPCIQPVFEYESWFHESDVWRDFIVRL